mgnify:CR=1 FL=1
MTLSLSSGSQQDTCICFTIHKRPPHALPFLLPPCFVLVLFTSIALLGSLLPSSTLSLLLFNNGLLHLVRLKRRSGGGTPYTPRVALVGLGVDLPRQDDILNLVLDLQRPGQHFAGLVVSRRLLRRRDAHDGLLGHERLVVRVDLVDLVGHEARIRPRLGVLDDFEADLLVGVAAVDGGSQLLAELGQAQALHGRLVARGKGLEHLLVHGFGGGRDLAALGLPFGSCGPAGHGF